jgi:pyruvate/2-oxoglutarate dehydrogenase complex dihydrolipoamide acyltransferase (E2) component
MKSKIGLTGNYKTHTFPSSRLLSMDTCHIGQSKHYVEALLALDVTEARRKIRENKNLGQNISFTAWLIKCIGGVCAQHKEIHAVRGGRRKVVVFDDVDISVIVERAVHGELVPLPCVIRKTNEKSVSEIYDEIKAAQNQSVQGEGDYVLGSGPSALAMKLFCALPGFFRRFCMNRVIRNPIAAKKMMGTVIVTSLGMMGRFNGWFRPIGVHPLIFAVGSINKAPGVVGDKIEIREYLNVTMMVDHDAVDGAPAARAISRFTGMVERGYGL